jgi:thioredoxin
MKNFGLAVFLSLLGGLFVITACNTNPSEDVKTEQIFAQNNKQNDKKFVQKKDTFNLKQNENVKSEKKDEINSEQILAQKVVQKNDGTDKKTVSKQEGKPEHLTAKTFREKVWNYEKNPKEWVFESNLPCIADFYADWCGPCKMVTPIMKNLAKKYKGKINIYEVNTGKEKELSAVFQIRSIPSILFCPKIGNPAMQPGALSEEKYIEIIEKFLLNKNKKK